MTYEQLEFVPNGNISPCPYKDDCLNYPSGCKGISHWCNRIPERRSNERIHKSAGLAVLQAHTT